MNDQQNATQLANRPDVQVANSSIDENADGLLPWRWQQFILFTAAGGLRQDEDGQLVEESATEFAARVGVNRTSIYRWPKMIPNFEQQVADAFHVIYGGKRIAQWLKGAHLKAVAGDSDARDFMARHFWTGFKPANAKGGNDDGLGLADLVNKVRNSSAPAEIVEGEIVDAPPSSTA